MFEPKLAWIKPIWTHAKIQLFYGLGILSWCSTLLLYAYTIPFSISHLQKFFEDCIFPIFYMGPTTIAPASFMKWNSVSVLKTLIKGSPCHQKRGLLWDFVVFSTSFWFFCEICLPLGPWHLAIAHWNLVLALGPYHWHIEIYYRTMANHDRKPKSWLSKSLVLLWILYGFTWFLCILCEIPCLWPLAICPWLLAICNRNW